MYFQDVALSINLPGYLENAHCQDSFGMKLASKQPKCFLGIHKTKRNATGGQTRVTFEKVSIHDFLLKRKNKL